MGDRRKFLKGAAAGATAAGALQAPAVHATPAELRWRLASSFPRSLDILFQASVAFARQVGELTDNRFVIEVSAAGELVPGQQAADAVQSGVVEICHTLSHYYATKDPVFALATSMPFGLNARLQNAWWQEGGGANLVNSFLAGHKLYGLAAGNTGAGMGGWYRKEIAAIEDVGGLKMRSDGLGGEVLAELGGVPNRIPFGTTYEALEKGIVDAAAWGCPYDDEKLALQKLAQVYHYPAWWAGGSMLHLFVNLERWQALPPPFQAALRGAAAQANANITARYDARNPAALRRLAQAGASLKPFPEPVLDAFFSAANKVCEDMGRSSESFRNIYQSQKAFRSDGYLWFQVAESSFDTYMMIQSRKRAL